MANALEIEGRITNFLPLQTGTSSKGEWKKQEFILETFEQYPKQVCINVWGDKIDALRNFQIGSAVKVSINISSREYNGRWYTEVGAWRIDLVNSDVNAGAAGAAGGHPSAGGTNYAQGAEMPQYPTVSNDGGSGDNLEDDLPF